MSPLRILLALLMSVGFATAQNLVPNSSFESNTGMPTGPGQYARCVGWNNVNGFPTFQWPYASPDYLHTSGSGLVQLPNTVFGTCTPLNGSAVMSALTWHGTTPNFREYFACQLTSPMIANQAYDVILNVTNATNGYSGWGSNGIQVAFSTAPLSQNTHEPINYTPQVQVGSVFYSSTWQTLTFNFTATQAFQYMTVGNFQNDANTLRSPGGSGGFSSYAFYDGLVVTPATVLDDGSLELRGQIDGPHNLLDWTQIGEARDIEVFRSPDGGQFQKVAEVALTEGVSFRDDTPPYGTNWYKIRKRNLDGSITWSNVVELKNDGASPLHLASVYPNPAVAELFVQLDHPPVEQVNATLIDLTGRIVQEKSVAADGQRRTTLELSVKDLAAGMYTLRVSAGPHSLSKSIVVGK
ncbi:MAG: T9SS type A sorting domain-containing protein [Bacteroidota bacterium]